MHRTIHRIRLAVVIPTLLAVHLAGQTAAVRGQDAAADQSAVRDFNATAALQNSGFYGRAAEKWQDFLHKHPQDERCDRVTYYLGICHLHTENYADASRMFQEVLAKFPQFSQADGVRYNWAMALFQAAGQSQKPEDYKAAAAKFGELLAQHSGSTYAPRSMYFQGESLYLAGDPQAALAAYEKLIGTAPNDPLRMDAQYALAATFQELGQDDKAVAALQAFLSLPNAARHESAPEVRLRLGMSLFKLKKFNEAEEAFAKAATIEGFPRADFALWRQGECRIEQDKLNDAATLFRELPKRFPESAYNSAANLAAGKCYYRLDKLSEAQNLLTPLARAREPESAEAAYWLGRALLKAGQPQQALAALDQAVATFQEGPFVAYLQLARDDALYELPERRKETADLYAAFVQQYPQHELAAQAGYMSALAALGQEDFAAARKNAEVFLANRAYAEHELLPAVTFIAAEACLLAAADRGGDPDRAEQLYRQVVEKFPDHANAPRSYLRIGWCLYQKAAYDQAAAYLESVMAKLPDPECQAEARFLAGRAHSGAGREDRGLAAYDGSLQAKSDWVRRDEVLLAAAYSLRKLDRPDEAAARLMSLLDSLPRSQLRNQALYQLGELAAEQEKADQAIGYFNRLVSEFSESPLVASAWYGLAAAHFGKTNYDQALPPLDRLLSSPREPALQSRAQYLRALVYQRLRQYEPALKDLQAFLSSQADVHDKDDARYALGQIQVALKQTDAAVATFTALMNERPEYAAADKVCYELGHALLEQGKQTDAAAAFRRLTDNFGSSPLAPEAWFHVGHAYELAAEALDDGAEKNAEWAKAAAAFANGIEKAEAAELKEKLQYKLGDMQFRQGRFAEAATTLMKQVQEFGQGELVGPARFLTAESLYRQDQFDQAYPLFEQVVRDKVEPYQAQAMYRAGACAGNRKQWPQSQQHYETLLNQFPDFEQIAEVHYGLAWSLQNQNQLDRAVSTYEQVADETETETAAKARFMIGEIAFARKQYEKAIENYLVTAVGYPYENWQALARFEAARCFIELKQIDKALESLQIVVDQFPQHPKAQDANNLMTQLKKP